MLTYGTEFAPGAGRAGLTRGGKVDNLARMKTLRARVRQNSDRRARASQNDRLRVQRSGPPKSSELFLTGAKSVGCAQASRHLR
eukprot:6998081-Prymnesium_polylepis.1